MTATSVICVHPRLMYNLVGIGIDIVEIDRIRSMVDRWGEKFLNRVFTDRELKEWEMRGKRMSLLAGKFATKEAFFKANKTNLQWKDIEVIGASFHPSVIRFSGRSLTNQTLTIDLSISHTQQLAIAVVITR